jgi:ProP effector
MTSNLPVDTPVVEEPTATTTSAPASKKPGRPKAVQDTLEKLFQLYPQLFGAEFLPLKLGVFQDLMAKHPDEFEKAALKTALGLHTRSTRYLNAVASGLDRHDLDAKPVAATAPEHMYLAIIELHRRRQNKTKEDLIPKLRKQLAWAFRKSGLAKQEYLEKLNALDATAHADLHAALAENDDFQAKKDAMRGAFQTSGKNLDAFAEMYGLDAKAVKALVKPVAKPASRKPKAR